MEGFAASYGRRGAGISNLEALAWKTGVQSDLVAPVIDARRGEVYAALYRRISSELIEESPPGVYKPEKWLETLPEGDIHFCGSGAERYRNLLGSEGWFYCKMDLYLAEAIAELASSPNRGPLEPLYVRRTDAEIAREGQHASHAGPSSKS
jgi:tRNA threonylcarbamoyladenosine biosynthesis protein TsaB